MTSLAVAADDTAAAVSSPRDMLLDALTAIETLVSTIPTDLYVTRVFGTTVGEQVARCAARVDGLFRGSDSGTIAYAPAAGDLAVDPMASLEKIRGLRVAGGSWPRTPLSRVVRVVHTAAAEDDGEVAWSTVDAETAFVVTEAVDAQRVIAAALRALGASVPEGFGDVAPPVLAARTSAPPVWALWQRLDEIANLLLAIPPALYTAPVEGRVSGTVGAHVRHCLDHVAALVGAEPSATLSYDRRRRGTTIEADPAAALQQILRLEQALQRWSSRSLDDPVRVASQIDPSGSSIVGWSTLGRELAFVLNHTIHHQATIAAVMALHGVAAPDGFGFAPSTPRQ
ncbi:MAG TPA: DinB family protein [Vicinamibacterales bacterium]|nr:DinB family protein [Vicinamibacterales bacterium]